MPNYLFRYADTSGNTIRSTIMQCESDAEAAQKARDTMRDDYAVLEIFENERVVPCEAHGTPS